MRFAMLGPVEVRDADDNVLDIGGRKQRAVLAMLGLRARSVVSADSLSEGVWGEYPPARALRTLSVYVSTLRSALEPVRSPGRHSGRIRTVPPGYVLDASDREVDVLEFETLMATGRDALKMERPIEAAEKLRAALALWRGAALADLIDVPFASIAAEQLDVARLEAVELRIEADLASGDHKAVVNELSELVERNPLRERFWAQLMLALYRDGRQAEALATFARARTVLAEEAGLDPDPDLVTLERRILAQDPDLRPTSPRTRLAPLPVPMDLMVGRDGLSASLGELLRRRPRLVTLLGTGGAGKTRLALEVARQVEADFRDGIAFADLSNVRDREAMLRAIASALGGAFDGERGPTGLGSDVSDRELLLVIDNFEQLVDEAKSLAAIIGAAPRLTVLTTSRRRIRLAGEHVFEVPPLDVPARGSGTAYLTEVTRSPAVELFLHRAREAYPILRVDDAMLLDVAEICRSLDGLPLAIEIAAARLRVMPPRQIRERLAELVDDEHRDARSAPHNLSLRAAVDWSLRLLSPAAKRGFASLSVFAGGFTLAALESLENSEQHGERPVSAWLLELVDASLVQSVEAPSGRRFRLLETLRAHADLLPSAADLPARHAAHYLQLGQAARPRLYGTEGRMAQQELMDDGGNFLAALHWAIDEAPSVATGLLLAWRPLWAVTPDLLTPTVDALTRLQDWRGPQPLEQSQVDVLLGSALYLRGNQAAAKELLERALPKLTDLDPASEVVVFGWCWLAATRLGTGDEAGAAFAAEVARANANASGLPRLASVAYDLSGYVALRAGDLVEARQFVKESIAIDEGSGDASSVAFDLMTLGDILVALGDTSEVRACAERILDVHAAGGVSDWVELGAVRLLTRAALVEREPLAAARLLLSSLPRWFGSGINEDISDQLLLTAATLAIAGQAAGAARLVGVCEQFSRDGGMAVVIPPLVASCIAQAEEQLGGRFGEFVAEGANAHESAEAIASTALRQLLAAAQ